MRVSVIGGSHVEKTTYETATAVGRTLADRGHTVVCGGLGGVMEATATGVDERDGECIGIIPGDDRERANSAVDTVIATGLGNARNVLVVMNGDAVIAIDGSSGTLSEIGHALDLGRPVAGVNTHDVDGVHAVESPTEAVKYVETSVDDG
ncbi:MAG: TIGR00725 family protein [Halanaeroarchaeum sp.]